MGIIKDIGDLLSSAKNLSSYVVGEKSVSLRLDCLNNLGVYNSTIKVTNGFSRWVNGIGKNDIKFDLDDVYNVKVIELRPEMREIKEAVRREDNCLVVDFKKCLNCEMLRFVVDYRMHDEFLRSIVHSRSSPESFEEETKYHLSAQLTDPSILVKGFSEVEVEEFPVSARIYVKEDIDTALPNLEWFKEIRSIERDILSDYDPRHAWKIAGLQRRRHDLRRRLLEENPQESMKTLLMLLRPGRFLTYLQLEQDFRLHKCEWGSEKLEMPGSVFLPEEMSVIVRTDLGLDKPAAKGVLHYRSGLFSKDLRSALKKSNK